MYSDISEHWARAAIEKWSENGVLTGSKGVFRPDDGLTLAELSTVMTRIIQLPEAAENIYEDLNGEAWYADAVLRCVADGIITAEDGKLYPTEPVTRERAFCMFARAFGIEPDTDVSVLDGYNDRKNITPGAEGYLAALLRIGVLRGESAVQLFPQEEMTRAQVVMVIDRLNALGYVSDSAEGG